MRLDTFTIVLPDPVDVAHARRPANDSERLLFRNLFRSLLHLDCEGKLRPGVVESWNQESNGAWTLTLGDNGQLGSGGQPPVTQVVGSLAPSTGTEVPGIDSAVALNDRQLRVFSTRNQDSVLHMLADPAFAMVEGLGGAAALAGSIDIPARGPLPVLQLRFPLRGDARDALDRGADLMVTREPALIEYATRRPEFVVHPLPWTRTYVLVQPAAAQPLDLVSTEPERQALARDAVHSEARGAEPPFWWSAGSCPAVHGQAAASMSDRIVYVLGDEVGRALAERLVALSGAEDDVQSAGLKPEQLLAALRDGSERAYVVALPRQTLNPCRDLPELPAGARVRPLIDSRAHAVVRRGAPPLSVDWDGTIRVVRP